MTPLSHLAIIRDRENSGDEGSQLLGISQLPIYHLTTDPAIRHVRLRGSRELPRIIDI